MLIVLTTLKDFVITNKISLYYIEIINCSFMGATVFQIIYNIDCTQSSKHMFLEYF